MKRKLPSLLLACAMVLGLFAALPAESQAAPVYRQSGLTSLPKLSQAEISALLAAAPVTNTEFAEEPSLTAPYSAGKLTDASLQAALDRVNLYRRIAGLKSVTLDSEFTAAAQTAAMLMAVNNKISHYPDRPEGMSDELYDLASTGAVHSNLGHSGGKSSLIYTAIDLCMDDTDSSNFDRLGHRRWILDPTAVRTGFGYAVNKGGFGVMYVVDSSRNRDQNLPDFVAWPASGNFPSTLFDREQAWSVSLNPKIYDAPQKYEGDFSMSITFPDGTTQIITRTYPLVYTDDCSEPFLHVSTTNTGSIAQCIIFRPDMTGYKEYPLGTYTISFDGLTTTTGQAVDFVYQVTLFDPSAPETDQKQPATGSDSTQNRPSTDPNQPATGSDSAQNRPASDLDSTGTGFIDVTEQDWHYSAVNYAVENGLFQGVGGNRFDPNGPMTRAMVMTVLARMNGEDTTPRAGETWDIRGKRWAVASRVSDGLNADTAITLEDLATMLHRAAGETEADDRLSAIGDGADVDSWAVDACNWAVETGLLQGDENGLLNPRRPATRAQVATILQRYLEEK